ncbi:UNVERIFIED_CONTAM: acyl-CoA synthetase (AMP-forming)/AMP-acid ligase II [Lysinibacillus xylanilyticus]|uniref:non-ribosomal peptide synthetase n=1 Tax=Lysinibacillus xylanilyticus TaxID=582475 RepID=UPI0006712BCA|nr:non-ribosomal peptide synthetase [Lysinibacillus xylanilyticus]
MHTTLVQAMMERNNENIGITFIRSSTKETFISYQELRENALQILHDLQSDGVKRGDLLLFQIGDNEMFLKVFWACLLGGIIPVPVTVGTTSDHKLKLLKIWESLDRAYLITEKQRFETLKKMKEDESYEQIIEEMEEKLLLVENFTYSNKGILHEAKPEDIAFIQFSSGSTNDPKGVELTHQNLITNINAINSAVEIHAVDSGLSWMPLTHDMGMIGCHLLYVVTNNNQYNMPTELFIRNPMLWLKKINEYRVTITCSPNFGFSYFLRRMKPKICEEWDLSCIKVIVNGAEPISYSLIDEFLTTMERYGLNRRVITNCYGLAEASLAVTFPKLGDGLAGVVVNRQTLNIGQKVEYLDQSNNGNDLTIVELGKAVNDCEIRICNEKNEVLGAKYLGFIHIKGKNLTNGYYNNPEAKRKVFIENQWLNTQDLGFFNEDGRLFMVGRAKEVIKLNGQNYYPNDIERVVVNIANISLENVAICGYYNYETETEEVHLYIANSAVSQKFVELATVIERKVQQEMGIKINRVIPLKRIPKTTSGKPQRFKLVEQYHEGEFNSVLTEMDNFRAAMMVNIELEQSKVTETEKSILKICRDIFENRTIGVSSNLVEYGGGSIQLVQIHERLDQLYPGKVTASDMYSCKTVSDIARLIDRKNAIHLDMITLPADYFNTGNIGKKEGMFESRLDPNITMNLLSIARVTGINTIDIFSAMYMYLFNQVSNEAKVTIQTLVHNQSTVVQLNANFDQINDLHTLFLKVSQNNQDENISTFSLEQLEYVVNRKNSNEIIPMLSKKHNGFQYYQTLFVFDLVLEVFEGKDYIDLLCIFNEGRLKKHKVKELFNQFMRLINNLSNKRELFVDSNATSNSKEGSRA